MGEIGVPEPRVGSPQELETQRRPSSQAETGRNSQASLSCAPLFPPITPSQARARATQPGDTRLSRARPARDGAAGHVDSRERTTELPQQRGVTR